MNKDDITTLAKGLIAMGRIAEALDALTRYVEAADKYSENDLLMQSSNYNRLERDYQNQLVDRAQYTSGLAKINHALTQIIERLPDSGNAVDPERYEEQIAGAPPPDPELEEAPPPDDEPQTPQATRKILFLTANPKGTGALQLGNELRKVKDELARSSARDSFELESETAVRVNTITLAMQRNRPEIVHFSGHGIDDKGIVIENDIGESVLFPTEGLDRLFKLFKSSVKCVVLNACYSTDQAKVISSHGIYVIGMNDEIEDAAATAFSVGFYQGLGEGQDVPFAFQIAMINITTSLSQADLPELWFNGEKVE